MTENRDLSGAVIFEITADRFETRSRTMRDNMDKLTALGFRFSIDHAGGLDIDLPRLQDAGVRFVKMNGDQLIIQYTSTRADEPEGISVELLGSDDLGITDPFIPFENLFCAVCMGGVFDVVQETFYYSPPP